MKDLADYFALESRELVDGLAAGLLDVERHGASVERIASLFRLAHTLKGAARVVGHDAVAELSHTLEDVLDHCRETGAALATREVSELLRLVDIIRGELASAAPDTANAPGGPPPDEARDAPLAVVRLDRREVDAQLRGVFEAQVHTGWLRGRAAAMRRVAHGVASLHQELVARPFDDERSRGRLRVRLEELEVGMRAISRELDERTTLLGHVLDGLAERTNAMRMLPFATALPSLERAARDAAEEQGKRVDIELRGGELLVDAHVVSAARDAMMHVVRNAVVHGIESPAEREARGKPARGLLVVSVARRGDRVVFACEDDGAGIDHELVREAAVLHGAIGVEASLRLSREEALRLIFLAAVSTAARVDELAGRGVGLDVVRETADRLRGDVAVESRRGAGTTLSLILPQSVSSFRALELRIDQVGRGGIVVLLPLASVVRVAVTSEVERAQLEQGAAVPIDGELQVLAHLGDVLEMGERAPGESGRIVAVLRAGDEVFAVAVDKLLGTTDVVVTPCPPGILEPSEGGSPVVSGIALDAEGTPRLALDPGALLRLLRERGPLARTPSLAGASPAPILVIDDSLTTRMLEKSILETAGYSVDVAVSAEEALEKARARRYGLFVCDVEMPGMGGLEFTAVTRADPELRSVAVVLVTSLARPEDRRRGAEAGAAAYVVKGQFEQREFLRLVEQLRS